MRNQSVRRFTLTVHVACSVGWLGAVSAFLVVAVLARSSDDLPTIRVLFPLMAKLVWIVILPFNLASLASGLVSALYSKWGVLRYKWVVTKLALNVGSTVVLLLYTMEIGYFSRMATKTSLSASELQTLSSPESVVRATLALLVLLTATVLAVYKPWGLTIHGQRKQYEERQLRRLSQGQEVS